MEHAPRPPETTAVFDLESHRLPGRWPPAGLTCLAGNINGVLASPWKPVSERAKEPRCLGQGLSSMDPRSLNWQASRYVPNQEAPR